MGALIFVVAFVVVALVLVFAGVKTVIQGTNWTIERFGRYTRTLPPGLHFIVPFVDTVGRKMNMQENVLDIPPQKVITKDNATSRSTPWPSTRWSTRRARPTRCRTSISPSPTSRSPTSAASWATWRSTRRCPSATTSTTRCWR